MPQLYRFDNDSKIGDISYEQLKFLNDYLANDVNTEFCVNSNTLRCLAGYGADPMLIGMLKDALGHDSWMEFTWCTDGPHTQWVQVVPAKPVRRDRRA
ncbi:hypothetical protein AB0D30_33465 [Streptomyces sp. NPDC048409]|uniref:hypothetical protein n=1 Tax=Streptomyces sp. NPDC048409 TaxID=3154723 RepID=UPI00343217A0